MQKQEAFDIFQSFAIALFSTLAFLTILLQINMGIYFLKILIQGELLKKNQKLQAEVKKIDKQQIYNNILTEILGEKSSSFYRQTC
ncbi:hypothetical protein SCLARK_00409 [Spiroplasma clarkii]|uniref:hypothetical protein n=1 Tax=Spiroplasma clarkii TaxID=2139 RepID=UPI000B583592|nr:hypothetical protein [Spiroplasma clarkii]ARU91131.1 hypothetical protein SCLARK_00409 [Spiroplasma clarkii]